jgi:dihydrofolate synthase/folylpolyglutamate synthase
VRDGLSRTAWPGRWEVVRTEPTVIVDGAHNPAAAAVAADAFRDWEPCRARRLLLLGILADKDAAGIVRCLAPLAALVGVTRSDSPRALAVDTLAQLAREHAEPVIRYDSVEEGLRDLVRRADPGDTLLVTGSLTVVAEARRSLASA